MKKLYLILAALVGLAFVSCQKSVDITVDPSTLEFTAEGGEGTFMVNGAVGGGITAESSNPEWCTTEISGTRVTVKVLPTGSEESRTATITVGYRSATRTVTVTQSALSVDFSGLKTEVTASYAGGNVSLGTVVANAKVNVEIPSEVTWINTPTVSESGEVTVKVEANMEGEERNCVLGVSVAGSEPQQVNLTQEGVNFALTIAMEEGEASWGNEKNVDVLLTRIGDVADYRFLVMEDGNYTDEQIISALLQEGNAYTSENTSHGENGAPDTLTFSLPGGLTYVAFAIPFDSEGNRGDLVDASISLNENSPGARYNNWIGDWELVHRAYDEKYTVVSGIKDTISIAANETGYTYYILGYEGVFLGSSEDESAKSPMAMDGAFNSSTDEIAFMGGQLEPGILLTYQDGRQENGYAIPIMLSDDPTPDGQFSAYFLDAEIAIMTAAWKEGAENIFISPVGLNTQEQGANFVGPGIILYVMSEDMTTQLGTLSAGTDWWLFDFEMTKISDTPSLGVAMNVAATTKYGASDKTSVGAPKFYTEANLNASNEIKSIKAR